MWLRNLRAYRLLRRRSSLPRSRRAFVLRALTAAALTLGREEAVQAALGRHLCSGPVGQWDAAWGTVRPRGERSGSRGGLRKWRGAWWRREATQGSTPHASPRSSSHHLSRSERQRAATKAPSLPRRTPHLCFDLVASSALELRTLIRRRYSSSQAPQAPTCCWCCRCPCKLYLGISAACHTTAPICVPDQ